MNSSSRQWLFISCVFVSIGSELCVIDLWCSLAHTALLSKAFQKRFNPEMLIYINLCEKSRFYSFSLWLLLTYQCLCLLMVPGSNGSCINCELLPGRCFKMVMVQVQQVGYTNSVCDDVYFHLWYSVMLVCGYSLITDSSLIVDCIRVRIQLI